MLKIKQHQNQFMLGIYLILSILMTVVINTKGIIWGGDDMVYHIGRLISLDSSFKSGVFMPNISTSNFSLIGYGINLFYPWVTMVPMILISLLIHDPVTAYYSGLAFFMFISFCIGHYAMKKFSNSNTQAIVFSLIYGLANYRLIDVFSRADLAEYLATVFLPLAFLGFYETFFRDYRKWPLLAAGMSLLLLSHVLTTVIVAFFFIIILILCWFMASDYQKRLKAVLAAILTSALASAVFLVPFLAEITYQKFQQPSPYVLKGENSIKLLQASLTNNANRTLDGNIYNIGIILLIALILGIFFFKSFNKTYRSIYLLAVLSFVMVMQIFPWSIFQKTPLNLIQFPFRFLLITTLLLAVIATKIFTDIFTNPDTMLKNFFVVGTLGIVMLGLWVVSVNGALHQKYLTAPDQTVNAKIIQSKSLYEGYYEQYSPMASQPYMKDIEGHIGYINGQKTVINVKPNGRFLTVKLNGLKSGTTIDLPIIKYRNSSVAIDGQRVNLTKSFRGTVAIKVKQNYQYAKLNIGYHMGFLAWFSLIISLLTWLWLVLEIVFKE